jgi:hypothetical protein
MQRTTTPLASGALRIDRTAYRRVNSMSLR